jgi:hypothetical protein
MPHPMHRYMHAPVLMRSLFFDDHFFFSSPPYPLINKSLRY